MKPFPFAALDALSRREIASAARVRRAVARGVRVDALRSAVSELVRESVEVLPRRYRHAEVARTPPDAVGVLVEIDGVTALVEAESALAAHVVSRALSRPPPRVVDPSRPAPSALSGAFAAIVLACLRRAHAETALRVAAAGPAMPLLRDLLERHGDATAVWLTVVVGADAFDARVTVPDAAIVAAPSAPFDGLALEGLRDAPIAVPIVIGRCLAHPDEIAALDRGDAFLVPGASLRSVALVPARGERGLAVDLADDGRLVLRGVVEAHPWDEVERMSGEGGANGNGTAEVLADAAVVVRVELGAVEMTAREWAALAPGDVVALGRKLGDPAILRVGGVEVARGELVQIDGEYGVRILGRPEGR